jgi:hypothetical protein
MASRFIAHPDSYTWRVSGAALGPRSHPMHTSRREVATIPAGVGA